MRKERVTIAVAAVAALAFSVFARAQDGPIMIGSSIPLTGGVATFGQHSRWGSELAIAEANAKGGVLGRKLEIDFQDNRCNPAEAVKSVTQMLAEKKYVAILDGLCSSVVLAIMPLVERAGVPLVVANASATSIAERSGVGGNKWTFKVNPTDASMLDALIGWLDKDGKANNIAFLGEDTDFGRAGSTGLENALKKRNLKLATVDFFQKGAPDFTPVFTKIKAKKPALLALYAVDADFQNAMRQWYSLGGGVPLTGRVLVDQVPKEIIDSGFLDGTTSVQPYDPSVDTPGNRAFVEAFKKLHNVPPILVSFEAYEATKVLIDAIRRAGTTNPAAVREALVTTKLPSILGTTIEFDDHNLAHNNAIILTIKGGKVVIVGMSKT
ncbi:MAG: ABC transporter substrate-binding protein [Candidatus Rokuibacteriota bacterium]|nr:MAG: ABC transporter substrate-binding protein [Candidatus Rokubacteria bacterium]